MKHSLKTAAVLLMALGLACGGSDSDSGPDRSEGMADAATGGAIDAAPDDEPVFLPTWSLLDIQPESPRFDTSYGLDVFQDQVIVAVLVEGF
ncbi:MAG: hypothetical protein KJO07_05900 [Deltaproteobacteria bacterium]|nr:hypothetical protein [Deltaproteobacteria bacterium]